MDNNRGRQLRIASQRRVGAILALDMCPALNEYYFLKR